MLRRILCSSCPSPAILLLPRHGPVPWGEACLNLRCLLGNVFQGFFQLFCSMGLHEVTKLRQACRQLCRWHSNMLIPELKKKVRQERIVQNPRGSLRPQGLPFASSLRKDSTSQYQTCSSLHCRHQEREAAPARTNIRWEPLGRDGSIWLGRRATPLPALTPRPPDRIYQDFFKTCVLSLPSFPFSFAGGEQPRYEHHCLAQENLLDGWGGGSPCTASES